MPAWIIAHELYWPANRLPIRGTCNVLIRTGRGCLSTHISRLANRLPVRAVRHNLRYASAASIWQLLLCRLVERINRCSPRRISNGSVGIEPTLRSRSGATRQSTQRDLLPKTLGLPSSQPYASVTVDLSTPYGSGVCASSSKSIYFCTFVSGVERIDADLVVFDVRDGLFHHLCYPPNLGFIAARAVWTSAIVA